MYYGCFNLPELLVSLTHTDSCRHFYCHRTGNELFIINSLFQRPGSNAYKNQVTKLVDNMIATKAFSKADCICTYLSTVLDKSLIVYWDKKNSVLLIARDHTGLTPVFWTWRDDLLLFASDLKWFFSVNGFKPVVNRDALALFVRHGYVPAPYSILAGVNKLKPGHMLQINANDGLAKAKQTQAKPYWSFNDIVEQGRTKPFKGSDVQAIQGLDDVVSSVLHEQIAVSGRVGSLLSGGVDSSLVTALMQGMSAAPIKTYTMRYADNSADESRYAADIAKHLGTEHSVLDISASDALAVARQLPEIFSEPLSSSSQIPLYLLAQHAAANVDTLFSGDGGDELFGGYNRYLSALRTWRSSQRLPKSLRIAAVKVLQSLSPESWDALAGISTHFLPQRYKLSGLGSKAQKLADVLSVDSEFEYFFKLVSHWQQPLSIVKNASERPTIITDKALWPDVDCFEDLMMALDAQTFLQEEGMQKINGSIRGAGLNACSPLLDSRVIELAWQMPLHMKIRNGQGKWLMRELLYQRVPRELIERPKQGFGIPVGKWLRGPLKPWAEDLLSIDSLESGGFFYSEPIRKIWIEHLDGKNDHQQKLWPILMFQGWARKWL